MSTVEFWDARYREADFAYGTAPNRFLMVCELDLPRASRVLVPGDGEGRNGVWLAGRGHRVTAVDQSAAGMAKARTLADQAQVDVEWVVADLVDWNPRPASFDALALVFVHLPAAVRRAVHRKLLAALRPGGHLIFEGFDRSHLGLPGGGPRDPTMLFSVDELREDFAALTDLRLERVETELDEGPHHQGRARVLRGRGRLPLPV